MWEFSGNPVYFCCYDYFAANDPTSIHIIVFSLEEPYEIQLNQVIFWLNFLKSLVPVEEPIGELAHPTVPSPGPCSRPGGTTARGQQQGSFGLSFLWQDPTSGRSQGSAAPFVRREFLQRPGDLPQRPSLSNSLRVVSGSLPAP